MRWGVRRFQYPDGRLTDKGRKRYNVGTSRVNQGSDANKEISKMTTKGQVIGLGIGVGIGTLVGGIPGIAIGGVIGGAIGHKIGKSRAEKVLEKLSDTQINNIDKKTINKGAENVDEIFAKFDRAESVFESPSAQKRMDAIRNNWDNMSNSERQTALQNEKGKLMSEYAKVMRREFPNVSEEGIQRETRSHANWFEEVYNLPHEWERKY